MNTERARRVLGIFLFEDIVNNTNYYQDEVGITWEGDYYLVYEYNTGKQHKFKVIIEDAPDYDFTKAIRDQEWEWE